MKDGGEREENDGVRGITEDYERSKRERDDEESEGEMQKVEEVTREREPKGRKGRLKKNEVERETK